MLNTKLRRTALVSLVVVLMLSVFAMTAFAEDVALITSANAGESVDVATAPEADAADLEVGTVVADEEVKATALKTCVNAVYHRSRFGEKSFVNTQEISRKLGIGIHIPTARAILKQAVKCTRLGKTFERKKKCIHFTVTR